MNGSYPSCNTASQLHQLRYVLRTHKPTEGAPVTPAPNPKPQEFTHLQKPCRHCHQEHRSSAQSFHPEVLPQTSFPLLEQQYPSL